MLVPDVNVLVYAHQDEQGAYADWLERVLAGPELIGFSELVLSSLVRITTNARLFSPPSPLDSALEFCDWLRNHPNVRLVSPGPAHWDIFSRLCREANVTGPRVSDAYLAAIAIEHDAEFISTDRDFARFPGLRWRHPLGS